MAKKELKFVSPNSDALAQNTTFVRASQLTGPGIVAQGLYTGTVPNKFEESKQDYKIEALEANADGTRDITIVNSAGNLGYRMGQVKVGDIIQISYLGKMEGTKGRSKGKLVHNFDVLRAE